MYNSTYEQKMVNEAWQLMSNIAAKFTSARIENYNLHINDALKMLGKFSNVDRAFIFRYDFTNQSCSNTYEYCKDNVTSAINNLQNIPLDAIDDLVITHKNKETYYISNVDNLPKKDRMYHALQSRGTKSLICVPLTKGNELYGFLGYDILFIPREINEYEKRMLFEFGYLLINLITRIELEESIKHQSQRIEHIIEAADICTWECDIKSECLKINDKWAQFLGYEKKELGCVTIDTWKKLTHPDDLKKALIEIEKLLKGEIDSYSVEFRMIHKNGGFVWIKASGKIVEWDNGVPSIVLGSHLNITKIKKQQQNTEILIKALEHIPTSIIITNAAAEIEYVNPFFTEKTGYTLDDVLGKNPKKLDSEDNKSDFYSDMWEQLHSGQIWKGEILSKKKNKETFWESLLMAPVPDENNIITHYIAIKNDITDIKESLIYLFEQKDELEALIRNKIYDAETAHKSVIIALAKLTESRDYGTGQHVERVQDLSRILARALLTNTKYRKFISQNFIEDIYYASALHDIGKIMIPDSILLKPSSLTPEEFSVIKQHIANGFDILSEMARQNPQNKIVMSARIAKYHHERWDGKGYGSGLKGDEIPLEARIVSLVDVYDALRSKRPYKDALSHKEAYEIIVAQSGKQFDPVLVSTFIKINDKFEVIFDSYENSIN